MLKQSTLKEEIGQFMAFFSVYIKKKVVVWGQKFEAFKSLLVAVLISQRGKYQQSFINASFFLLAATIYVSAPIIAENNPLIGQNLEVSQNSGSNTVISMYSLGTGGPMLTTKISQKPRDSIVRYKVQPGDTLNTIAAKFDISVDTLKWANDLKSDTITTGDNLDVPPVTGIVHRVQSGDNVYSIAEKYGTGAQKIVNFPFNEFTDQDTFALLPGQILFVPDGVPPSEVPVRRQDLAITPQYTAGQTGSTGTFIWPTTGSISQYPVWYHMALDIANPAAPAIIAADSGTVSYAGCIAWGYGCHVILDHDNGYQTLYAHMSVLGVSVGQSVGKGEGLGVMGSTGRSTGTHLHFEIRQSGAILNPLNFLQ